jgi:MoaA/NifB/PqqE/SkfB family radical SAM enzyme
MNRIIFVLRITDNCNLDCSFCIYRKSNKNIYRRTCGDVYHKLIDLIDDSIIDNNNFHISLLGGEPTLEKEIYKITKKAKKKNIYTSMTTNGVALNDKNINNIKMFFDEITISIDGLKEYHDFERGKYIFDKVINNIIRLRKSYEGIIRINTLISSMNIIDFEKFLKNLIEIKAVDELTYNLLTNSKYKTEHLTYEAYKAYFVDKMPYFKEKYGKNIKICGSDNYINKLGKLIKGEKTPFYQCPILGKSFFIESNGIISNCSYTSNVSNVSIYDIDTKIFNSLAKSGINAKYIACYDCHDSNCFGKFL